MQLSAVLFVALWPVTAGQVATVANTPLTPQRQLAYGSTASTPPGLSVPSTPSTPETTGGTSDTASTPEVVSVANTPLTPETPGGTSDTASKVATIANTVATIANTPLTPDATVGTPVDTVGTAVDTVGTPVVTVGTPVDTSIPVARGGTQEATVGAASTPPPIGVQVQVGETDAQGDGLQAAPLFNPYDDKTNAIDIHQQKCIRNVPRMPIKFRAERKFASFSNIIFFLDRNGHEFGWVESNFIDWKNPFGYPGATFYLKTLPAEGNQGVYHLNPSRGSYGWPSDTSKPDNVNESIWNQRQNYVRQHGSDAYDVENQRGFLRSTYGMTQNRYVASMTVKHKTPYFGDPFSDHMVIEDCRGKKLFKVKDQRIKVHEAGSDAQFRTHRKNTENTMKIYDYSTPVRELVRVAMKEPCWPFPPFCQQMGMWNWFMHKNRWFGEIVAPGYNMSSEDGLLFAQVDDGAATDMRFLALYTAYEFSNTRFSPLMHVIFHVLLLICLAFCCCCCCNRVIHPGEHAKKEKTIQEETERLMGTVEVHHDSHFQPASKDNYLNPMACCSRRVPIPQEHKTFWENRKDQMSSAMGSGKTKVAAAGGGHGGGGGGGGGGGHGH